MRKFWIACLVTLGLTLGVGAQGESDGHKHGHQHQGGHHNFSDAEKWIEKFEDPSRDEWQKPDLVVAKLELKPGMNVADIGGASGYFTRRMAEQILPGGFALLVDIESNFFPYVLERSYKAQQYNLFTVESTADNPRLPKASLDLILIVNTLHHIEERPTYYQILKESLRGEGRIVVVDFKKDAEIPVGPKPAMRLRDSDVKKELEEAGFSVVVDNATLDYQYIITASL